MEPAPCDYAGAWCPCEGDVSFAETTIPHNGDRECLSVCEAHRAAMFMDDVSPEEFREEGVPSTTF